MGLQRREYSSRVNHLCFWKSETTSSNGLLIQQCPPFTVNVTQWVCTPCHRGVGGWLLPAIGDPPAGGQGRDPNTQEAFSFPSVDVFCKNCLLFKGDGDFTLQQKQCLTFLGFSLKSEMYKANYALYSICDLTLSRYAISPKQNISFLCLAIQLTFLCQYLEQVWEQWKSVCRSLHFIRVTKHPQNPKSTAQFPFHLCPASVKHILPAIIHFCFEVIFK